MGSRPNCTQLHSKVFIKIKLVSNIIHEIFCDQLLLEHYILSMTFVDMTSRNFFFFKQLSFNFFKYVLLEICSEMNFTNIIFCCHKRQLKKISIVVIFRNKICFFFKLLLIYLLNFSYFFIFLI